MKFLTFELKTFIYVILIDALQTVFSKLEIVTLLISKIWKPLSTKINLNEIFNF